MKKLLSVFLAVVMLFSISVSAFAASTVIKENEKVIATIGSKTVSYTFTATDNAVYCVKAKLINYGALTVEVNYDDESINEAMLVDFDGIEESEWIPENSCEVLFCAEKNEDFVIKIRDFKYMAEDIFDEDAKIELTVEKYNAKDLQLGKNTVENGTEVFLFIPNRSGYYNFRSNADAGVDPVVEINNIYGSYDYGDDNGYNYNFDLTSYLTAGNVYAVECYCYDDETVTYEMTVSYNLKIDADYIELETDGEDKITMCVGDYYISGVLIVPTGAIPTTEITVAVDNEKIATVEYEDGCVYIVAFKAGRTTLTITTDDGLSAEYTIRVLPRTLGVVRDILDNISYMFTAFFYMIFGWMFE